ncbi:MAG: hypothetical protein EOO92_13635 [Pedobacter sp.]|nr:MAG: hypothetical protein EOO92_13635 [Pedobacter sp.]
MKTDLIEIFQTIRASMQPYAALGFDNRTSSETVYDLWSNKNVTIEGEQWNEVFFASVVIENDAVIFSLLPEQLKGEKKQLKELDDAVLVAIEDALAAAFKEFKEKDWVV